MFALLSLPSLPAIGGHDLWQDLLRNGACWWVFSVIIRTMPEPPVVNSWAYTWVHNALQMIAANMDRVAGANHGIMKPESGK